MNLLDEQLPYKHLIGSVLLDKVPQCRTVVNKIGKIDTAFRTFDMEVLAGENNTHVSLNENGCRYDFDYSRVYWNSRLHHEHARLIKSFSPSDIVADMFCGVGPFSIPAAKKGCTVYANDLNPSCFYYLNRNVEKNHVRPVSALQWSLGGKENHHVQSRCSPFHWVASLLKHSHHTDYHESACFRRAVLLRLAGSLRRIPSLPCANSFRTIRICLPRFIAICLVRVRVQSRTAFR